MLLEIVSDWKWTFTEVSMKDLSKDNIIFFSDRQMEFNIENIKIQIQD